jgi:hypothetical protein
LGCGAECDGDGLGHGNECSEQPDTVRLIQLRS